MDEAEPPSRAEPWASALRTASPRSTYGASPRFTPRSSRVGASSAAGSSTSPRSFGGPNVTTLKLEALLARMEARMEEVDRKVDRTEKATREIARLKVQVESQQMSISSFAGEMKDLQKELVGVERRVVERVESAVDVPGVERRLAAMVEAQNEKTLAMRETFDTNHFELRKSLERSQKEAVEAQSEGLSELIEDIEAKIEPTAQKAAQEAMDASQKEFEGARLAMREELEELVERCGGLQNKLDAGLVQLEEQVRTDAKAQRAVIDEVAKTMELARASDREAYKKDALALRSEIAELSATLQEHHSDGWIVAVAELEKQVLEGVEAAAEWRAKWEISAEQSRLAQQEAIEDVAEAAESGRMELKEQQQALLDAVAEEGRAAVLRTQTLHETYQTSVKHTVQTLEAKMGPALALTREALREELATVEARAHEELGAMAERLGAELAIRAGGLDAAIERLCARAEDESTRLNTRYDLLRAELTDLDRMTKHTVAGLDGVVDTLQDKWDSTEARLEEMNASLDVNLMLAESHAIVEERAGLDRLALESRERAQTLAATQQQRVDELAQAKQQQVQQLQLASERGAQARAAEKQQQIDALTMKVKLEQIGCQELQEAVKTSVASLEQVVVERDEKWASLQERVEELAVSFDLNQMLVESHAVVEERAGVDRLALESQERAQALVAEQQHRLDELAAEKQMQMDALATKTRLEQIGTKQLSDQVTKSVGDLEALVTAHDERWIELEERMREVLSSCELNAMLVESGALAAEYVTLSPQGGYSAGTKKPPKTSRDKPRPDNFSYSSPGIKSPRESSYVKATYLARQRAR